MTEQQAGKEQNSFDLLDILAQSRALLDFHREINLAYPLSGPVKKFLDAAPPSLSFSGQPAAKHKASTKTSPEPQISLNEVNAEIRGCDRCALAQDRAGILPGQGSENPALFIVTDRLSREDINAGKVVGGPAGELLAKMLSAINLQENDVYLTSIIKCCPKSAREPDSAEIRACLPFISRQIEAVRPRIIYALGSIAAQALLNSKDPLIRLRGRFHQYNSIPLLPSFHPAFLLKNPEIKKAAWHDLQKIAHYLQGNK